MKFTVCDDVIDDNSGSFSGANVEEIVNDYRKERSAEAVEKCDENIDDSYRFCIFTGKHPQVKTSGGFCAARDRKLNGGRSRASGNTRTERRITDEEKAVIREQREIAAAQVMQQKIAERQLRQLKKHAGKIGVWKLERDTTLPVSDVRAGSLAVRREFEVGTFRNYAPRLEGERRGKYD